MIPNPDSNALTPTTSGPAAETDARGGDDLDVWEAKRAAFLARQIEKASRIADPTLRELFLAIFTGIDGDGDPYL